jgi:inositol phosphorylceramide mannosyltransferase catalytic subunit
MKKFYLTFLFLCLWSLSCSAIDNFRLIYPDFDQSLCRSGRSKALYNKNFGRFDTSFAPLYVQQKDALKVLYNLDRQKPFIFTGNSKIPKIIHQIWLGGTLPERLKDWAETWKNWEGWEHRLWTDEDVKNLNLINSELFDSAHNYGEKADILRLEILYRFGGLYVDTDMECFNRDFFEFANHEYSFYCGILPLECIRKWEKCKFSLANAVLASVAYHPMLEKIIMELASYAKDNKRGGTVFKTGPRYISNQVLNNLKLLGHEGIIFPTTFFYPIHKNEMDYLQELLQPESAGVHYWDGSWTRPEGQVHRTKN